MSTDIADLKKLVKQLQNASTNEDIQDIKDILSILKKEYQVNETILRESKAGLAVGKLRSHASKEVSDLAKELVKKWKNEVEKAKTQNGGTAATVKVVNGKSAKRPAGSSMPTTSAAATGAKSDSRSAKGDGIKTDLTGDSTRDRCMEIIYDALASDSGAPSDQILSRAQGIEATVLKEFNNKTTAAYKSKIRTLFVNLKDKNNPTLRESVVSGYISVERLCQMSSQDMASEERKAADRKIMEENLFNSLGAAEQQAETDAFQCGRCKQRKCRYRQAQTRSADEPMTTYVTCTNCGNRWKFS